MASPAAREPGPLVIFVRCRTVENVDSMGFVVHRWIHPVWGGIVVEREQYLDIPGDLGDGLWEFRAIGGIEGLHRVQGVPFVLGIPDLCQSLLRPRMRGLRQRRQHIGDLVKLMPA
jgi:hypothetical protein